MPHSIAELGRCREDEKVPFRSNAHSCAFGKTRRDFVGRRKSDEATYHAPIKCQGY
jgi:hypothetical protein